MWVIGGLISTFMAYFLNKFIVNKYGDKAIIYGVPFAEEFSKTIIGYFSGSIIGVHAVFGIAEALNDFFSASKRVNFRAAMLSIMSHVVFGLMTCYITTYINIYVAVIFASFIHGYWNRIMLR